MTLEEMKQKVYTLIEEYNEDSEELTDDEDFALKINNVINQIQNEISRIKKIPANATREVEEDEEVMFEDIDSNIYQLYNIRGVDYDTMNDMIIFNEEGTARIFYYKYPEQITMDTEDDFEFELSRDVLEIMPYGVAADLLKSDASSQYGAIYMARYQQLLQELDPRYALTSVSLSDGVEI